MSIKNKFKTLFGKLKKSDKNVSERKRKTDSEISAGDVTREEVYPKPRHNSSPSCAPKKSCRPGTDCGAEKSKKSGCSKPASKRTRPTNAGYEMIDPDNNTCDTGKS